MQVFLCTIARSKLGVMHRSLSSLTLREVTLTDSLLGARSYAKEATAKADYRSANSQKHSEQSFDLDKVVGCAL